MNENQIKLKSYIQQQIQSGQSPDTIQSQLTTVGWPAEDVQAAFAAVQAEVVPTSFSPQISPAPASESAAISSSASTPHFTTQKRGRLRTGWQLFKQSWAILRGNKYLLRYMYMTGLWVFLITAVFVGIFILFDAVLFVGKSDNLQYLGYALAFLDYVAIYFFINLYAAGLTANVLDIFKGNKQDYHSYMKIAWSKASTILLFSIIAATVGMILQYVVERIRFVGWILSWFLGTLWSLGTLFVIPIIVTEQSRNAPQSIKQSVQFFKQTWGENITAKVSVNAPLALLNILLVMVFFAAGFAAVIALNYAAVIIVVVIYMIIAVTLAVIGSFANSLVNIALFYYAQSHTVPPGFSEEMLNQVFIQHKRRFFSKKDKTLAA